MQQKKEKEKSLIFRVILCIIILLLVVAFIYFIFINKERLTNLQNNSELETINIYKYEDGSYGIQDIDMKSKKLYSIKCKNYSQNNDVFIAFDGSKFYFIDLSLEKPLLEELVLNSTYNYNEMNIKIDVYSKGNYNGYVINGKEISTDFKENAWSSFVYDNKDYELSFDYKTLKQGYIAIYNQIDTTIYNTKDNAVKLKLNGNYSFYRYDDNNYALKKFAEDQSVYEQEGKRKVIYSLYDDHFKFIKNIEKIVDVI